MQQNASPVPLAVTPAVGLQCVLLAQLAVTPALRVQRLVPLAQLAVTPTVAVSQTTHRLMYQMVLQPTHQPSCQPSCQPTHQALWHQWHPALVLVLVLVLSRLWLQLMHRLVHQPMHHPILPVTHQALRRVSPVPLAVTQALPVLHRVLLVPPAVTQSQQGLTPQQHVLLVKEAATPTAAVLHSALLAQLDGVQQSLVRSRTFLAAFAIPAMQWYWVRAFTALRAIRSPLLAQWA